MRCLSPRTVGFAADGKTIVWSQKKLSKEYASFQLPCSKCIECRLEYARQWAIRCVHEAQMHSKSSFITLTYSDEHLKSPKLIYSDFQKFMKRLRRSQENPIGVFVTGEYGDKTKRPHWHALLFGWRPADLVYHRSNERGDKIYRSSHLDRLWTFNDPVARPNEVGDVTFHSAGYCARYAAKKLVHGLDGTHEFDPISKKSSKNAIGKAWIEKYWADVFSYGYVALRDGSRTSIPRYYEKWFKEHKPDLWLDYVTGVKTKIVEQAQFKSDQEWSEYIERAYSRFEEHRVDARQTTFGPPRQLTPSEVKQKLIDAKFKHLQSHLKL